MLASRSRYRSSSSQSGADETLFGRPAPTKSSLSTNAVVITKSELAKFKADSKMWTAADEEANRRALEAAQEEKLRAARERKAKMLELEANAKAKARKSEVEVERETRKATIRKLAEECKDENLDLVKLLNTLGARAAAFTIRDQQIAEKRTMEAKNQEYEKRMELLMEIKRLEDLKRRDAIETERRAKRIEDRQVIVEQIERRNKQKLMEEEQREQENAAMLELVAKYRAEDLATKKKHNEDVLAARTEVMAANVAAIERKELAKQREREEEEAILLYQARKDEQLRKREQEEKDREASMKERQAKLLEAQEKTQSTQVELDELRARRWAEERERRERQRELAQAESKAKRVREMQEAHRRQAEQRKQQLEGEAAQQRAEFEARLRQEQAIIERERKEEADKAQRAKEHRAALQRQIEEARDAKNAITRSKLDEGQKLRNEFAAERAKLHAIRDKMVVDMEKRGYNQRYLSEIRSVDIEKLQTR